MTGNNQKQFTFSSNPGLKITIPTDFTAWNCLNLFLTNEIIDLIVVETNRNAEQFLSKNQLTKSSRFVKWVPTEAKEIKKFFGLLIWMGLVQMPTLEDYWSQNIRYKTNVAQKTMSRNRFQSILRFLHFSDDEKAPNNDKIKTYKVRHLINKIVENFQMAMEPEEYLAVDETMIPFRGRIIYRQYTPEKIDKYIGVKLCKLCGTNGYTYNLKIYGGNSQVNRRGVGCRIVLDLSHRYLNVGRTIVTDNYYTSMDLAYELLKNNTHLVGTLRSNRVHLPEVTKVKLKPGEIVGKENGEGIVVAKWWDKRNVTMLSTRHNIDMIDTGKMNKNKENIIKPKIIIDYKYGKSGIDLSNRLSNSNMSVRKSIRWYHKVATEILLGTSVVNALIIYNKCNPDKKLKITQFRETLVDEILELETLDKFKFIGYEPFTSANKIKIGNAKHIFQETTEKCNRNRKIRKRCAHCYQNQKSHEESTRDTVKKISTFCATCKVYTCINCFNIYHIN